MTTTARPARYAALVALTMGGALAGCGGNDGDSGGDSGGDTGGPSPSPTAAVDIKTLSNRADLISGNDALIEVVLPAGATAAGLKVDVDGRDATSAFMRHADGRIIGVVTGLKAGANVVTASTASTRAAKLTITNAARGGPIYSGAQITPFVCATPTPQVATGTLPATNASGLSTSATDAQCNIATEFKLYYRTTATAGTGAGQCSPALPDPSPSVPFTSTTVPSTPTQPANLCFKPYDPNAPRPADMATTTTDAGVTVPYIVRVERGTINRGIYDVAVLFDPTRPAWTAVAPQPQWNGKVYYQFGASNGQPRRQQRPQLSWTDDKSLARGYIVVQNSMSDALQNSNRVMMTETVMMMKEHIVDTYGPIKFTMGTGCSGGSNNSHSTMTITPNLIDGFTVSCTYPDAETAAIEVGECHLLVEAYQKPAWLDLMSASGYTQAQINAKKAAINGHEDQTACHGWVNLFGGIYKAGNYLPRTVTDQATGAITQASTQTNNCQLPLNQVYDPVNNPNGPRCNAWSWAESIWGKANATQANDPRDNVGVLYGLRALRSGVITAEEFVTINEIIGGVDRDGNLVATRRAADAAALEVAYRAGIVLNGKNHAKHAEIDMRGYDDSLIPHPNLAPGAFLTGIHHVWRSFALRDRLDRDAGSHDNHVMWRFGRNGFFSPPGMMGTEAFLTMDRWLTNLKANTSTAPIEQKIKASKPAEAFDYCLLSTDVTQSNKVTNQAACDADPLLNPEASPRQVAGGPRAEDIFKCQLKPLSAADYAPATLSGAQLTRMQAVFPQGVCDWSKPGVGQQAPVSPLTFRAGPGGQAFPAAPVSIAQ